MKSHSKKVKIQLLLKKSENISFLEKKKVTIFTLFSVNFHFKGEISLEKKKVRFHSKRMKIVTFFLKNGCIFTLLEWDFIETASNLEYTFIIIFFYHCYDHGVTRDVFSHICRYRFPTIIIRTWRAISRNFVSDDPALSHWILFRYHVTRDNAVSVKRIIRDNPWPSLADRTKTPARSRLLTPKIRSMTGQKSIRPIRNLIIAINKCLLLESPTQREYADNPRELFIFRPEMRGTSECMWYNRQ